MWIKRAQRAIHSGMNQIAIADRIQVVKPDLIEQTGKCLELLVAGGLGAGRLGKHGHGAHSEERTCSSHFNPSN